MNGLEPSTFCMARADQRRLELTFAQQSGLRIQQDARRVCNRHKKLATKLARVLWRFKCDLTLGSDVVGVRPIPRGIAFIVCRSSSESLLKKSARSCSGLRPVPITKGAVPKPRLASHFPASILSAVLARSSSITETMYPQSPLVITDELAHTSAKAFGTSTRITPDARSKALARDSPEARCFRTALNDAHASSIALALDDRFGFRRRRDV